MRTRSGSLYPCNSVDTEHMAREHKKRSTNYVVPSHAKNPKRKGGELRVLDMNSVTFLKSRHQSKSKATCESSEKILQKKKNCVRYWKKLKVTKNTYELEKSVLQQRNRKRKCRDEEFDFGADTAKKLSRNKNHDVHDKNLFDILPEDLILDIMCKLGASANSPSDIINARLACKKFNEFVQHPWVLARASTQSLSVPAKNWSESADRFLKMCAEAGNLEACYMLGMIYFYCKANRRSGAAYMAKAAMGSHPSALYSLAIIQFNGSGGTKSDKNLRAGVALCGRAASLGHTNAIRELGYCLQDGYGIRRQMEQGRRYLCAATNLELQSIFYHYPRYRELFASLSQIKEKESCASNAAQTSGSIALGLECAIPGLEPHPANRFLVDWWTSRAESRDKEMRACSHVLCGRVETRQHEFRRCSVCGKANYCSRACQAMDWKRAHRRECVPPVHEAPPVGGLAVQYIADLAAEIIAAWP